MEFHTFYCETQARRSNNEHENQTKKKKQQLDEIWRMLMNWMGIEEFAGIALFLEVTMAINQSIDRFRFVHVTLSPMNKPNLPNKLP